MFPLSIEGAIPASAKTEAEVRALGERICGEIAPLGLKGTTQGSVISFANDTSRYFQMTRFARAILVADSGELSVVADSISYRFSTRIAFIIYSMLASLPLLLCLIIRSVVGVIVVLAWWSMAFVLSYFLTAARIRRTLRRAVATPSPSLSP